jgi:hypothetical protein
VRLRTASHRGGDAFELRSHPVGKPPGLVDISDSFPDGIDGVVDVLKGLASHHERFEPELMELPFHQRSLSIREDDQVGIEREHLLEVGIGPSPDSRQVGHLRRKLAIGRDRHHPIEGMDAMQDLGRVRREGNDPLGSL